MKALAISFCLFAAVLPAADLAGVKAEPDPAKRSERALDNANAALDEARAAGQAEDAGKMNKALQEIRDSVQLCYDSLVETHQKPHRSKYYKRAELRLRTLARMISGFSDQLAVDARDPAVETEKAVQAVRDKILSDELEKK